MLSDGDRASHVGVRGAAHEPAGCRRNRFGRQAQHILRCSARHDVKARRRGRTGRDDISRNATRRSHAFAPSDLDHIPAVRSGACSPSDESALGQNDGVGAQITGQRICAQSVDQNVVHSRARQRVIACIPAYPDGAVRQIVTQIDRVRRAPTSPDLDTGIGVPSEVGERMRGRLRVAGKDHADDVVGGDVAIRGQRDLGCAARHEAEC